MSDATTVAGKELFDEEKFETAFQAVLQMNKKDYPSYIKGMKIASGNTFPVNSPIDNSIRFGLFQDPEAGISQRAVEASLEVYSDWSKTDVSVRVEYFQKVLKELKLQRYRLAAIVLLSSGMTPKESVAEVDRLIDILESECKRVKDIKGESTGAWAVITSHNSPLASPAGFASVAMLAGNTVVVMPSKFCPVPVYTFYEILERAGLPSGVMNLVADRKDDTAESLANDPRVAGVVVSGSGSNVEEMIFLQIDDELRFINELKGMNPIIIHRPIDNDRAVKDVISSAFSYSGQRLYSTSKIIIVADSQQRFMDSFSSQLKDIRIGDPAEKGIFAGPLISEANGKRFLEIVSKEKECLIFGGKKVIDDFTRSGSYMIPAVFMGLGDEKEITYMDSGLPILHVKIVNDVEAALEEVENTECGLSVGIFSKDQKVISMLRENANVGTVFVNESSVSIQPAQEAKIENFVK